MPQTDRIDGDRVSKAVFFFVSKKKPQKYLFIFQKAKRGENENWIVSILGT